MSKWTNIYSNTTDTTYEGMSKDQVKAKQVKTARCFDKAIKTTKTESAFKLKEISNEHFKAAKAREASLISALDEKKLKSNALIKEATALKAAQEKKAKSAK